MCKHGSMTRFFDLQDGGRICWCYNCGAYRLNKELPGKDWIGDWIVPIVQPSDELLAAAKHAAMEWRLHGQLTDSCRGIEAAVTKLEAVMTKPAVPEPLGELSAVIRCGMCSQPLPEPWTVEAWKAHRKVCTVSSIGKMLQDARERRRQEHPMSEEVKALLQEKAAERKRKGS